MTVLAAEADLTEQEARRLTERIRSALDRVSTAWADLADRITEAYQRRADLALGYGSWAEYADAELKPAEGLAADVRRQLVGMLSAQGMSTRAIAPTVGVSQQAVAKALHHPDVTTKLSPEPDPVERIDPATGEIVPAPVAPTHHASEPAHVQARIAALTETPARPLNTPGKVTGLDGKTYTRPAPKPTETHRSPLRDGFRDAALDLDKIVHRFERLVADDRLARNREEVARYANDLTRAIDALQHVAEQLT